MDFDPMTLPPAVRSGMYTTMQLGAKVPMADSSLRTKRWLTSALHCPFPGVAMTFGRELTEFVLRNHALFSSTVEMPLGNIGPLIPLNIDPPKHGKYRKILDPLFAPKRMDALESDIAARANRFIDAIEARGGTSTPNSRRPEHYPDCG